VSYLMESGTEGQRLEAKTDPHVTARLLSQVGLRAGACVLDAGCGTGAVARVMSTMVGASGRVTAVDKSEARLEQGRRMALESQLENLSFLPADIEESDVPGAPYDLVWCRFVFEYVADKSRTLDNLVRATRIGGKVVVGDLDGNAVFHYPCPPDVEQGLARILAELDGRFDPYVGRKLFHLFHRQGLGAIQVHVEPYHLYAGSAPAAAMQNWEHKLATIRPAGIRALNGEAEYDRWATEFLDMLRAPDTFSYSSFVLVEGIRQQ
jgi:ubiquinone/menaquinone biosynthesis C-methylase UbiE